MNIEKLQAAGVNYEQGVKRFAGKKELYEKFLKRFPGEETFVELEKNIREKEYEQAFRSAHSLKGISGNLSIDSFYEKLIPLVEELRVGNTEHAAEHFAELKQVYDQVVAQIEAD